MQLKAIKQPAFVPVYQPYLNGNEKKYVNECLDSSWISSKGEFITRFENTFANYVKTPFATSVCNGTVALHLALAALDIKPGDEIIVPTLTYVASVNTIIQVGAVPVFVDSLESTWQLDPASIRAKITPKTKAIMAVHLYGHPCDMTALQQICAEKKLFLIEDCAEAFGTYFENQHVGTFGDIATFSFYGNKTITTGEGGMVIAKDENVFKLAARLKNQGISEKMYWHDLVAYNYRMTNICAAIGLAQIEQIDPILQRKREIAKQYERELENLPLKTHVEVGNVKHSYWMCSILLDDAKHRDNLRDFLLKNGIETRPLFYPVHTMPMYNSKKENFPIADSIGSRGMNLPSYPALTNSEITYITDKIREYFS